MNPSPPPTQNGGGAPSAPEYIKPKSLWDILYNASLYLNNKIMAINGSKLFAGLVIITLNISSKFVTIKLSKSVEAYLKYTFSRDVLIFAMAWMGTRDIYIALFMMLLFKIFATYFFNEDSRFCLLPEQFTTYHNSLADNDLITDQQYSEAMVTMAKYEAQHPQFAETITKENFDTRVHDRLVVFGQPRRDGEEEDVKPYDNY